MTRIALVVGIVALVAGCSKDKGDAPASERKAAPGVSVVPASELGPQGDEIVNEVSITTTSKEARDAFVRGRELFENIRHAEAAEKFRAAIELDEKFALAHTYLGMTEYGPQALELLRRGFQLAETLPPAERMVTKVFLLKHEGDRDKYTAAVEKMAELAPGDWRVQMWRAHNLQDIGEIDAALAAFEKSTRLNDKAAEPYNFIAYIHANAARYDKAVAAAKKYAALKPSEPNPQDSLGEILMMAGEFEEAEGAFTKALGIAPKFTIAWEGVAMTRLYRKDFDGALEALGKARDGALNDKGHNKAVKQVAWVKLTNGDVDGAIAAVGDLKTKKDYDHTIALARAELYAAAGDYSAAKKQLAPVIKKLEAKGDDGVEPLAWALVTKAIIQAEAGMVPKAEQTLGEIEALSGKVKNSYFRYGEAYARGVVAMASGQHDKAYAHLDQITNPLFPYGVDAMWKKADCMSEAGKSAEAQQLTARLQSTYRREAFHAYRLMRAK